MRNNKNLPKYSENFYIRTNIDVVDHQFAQELQEVTDGLKSVEDISMIIELREALIIEEQNDDGQNEIVRQLSKNNHELFSRIIQMIVEFVEDLPVYDTSIPNTFASVHTSNIDCFKRIMNGLMILFNETHLILIQFIENNCTIENNVGIVECQQHYEAVLHAIEQNSTFTNYPLILTTARELYQHLLIAIQKETTIPVEQIVEYEYPMSSTSNSMIKLILWLIMITGVILFGLFLITHDDKIMMGMGVML